MVVEFAEEAAAGFAERGVVASVVGFVVEIVQSIEERVGMEGGVDVEGGAVYNKVEHYRKKVRVGVGVQVQVWVWVRVWVQVVG